MTAKTPTKKTGKTTRKSAPAKPATRATTSTRSKAPAARSSTAKTPPTIAAGGGDAASRVLGAAGLIESYSKIIAGLAELDVQTFVLRPSPASAIASLEKGLGFTLPADVSAFLTRGLKSVEGALDEPFAAIGMDFLDARRALAHTQLLRQAASDFPPDDPHARVIRSGVALTYSEPELVVTDEGAVYHFSFRNPLLRITASFADFLEHYLAAGCFGSHSFPGLWKVVSAHVPETTIAPSKNAWVAAYKKQFPDYFKGARL
jgi:hypothetical protein